MSEFKYTYSAPTEEERKHIESIRKQYIAEEKAGDKLAELKKLDSRVHNSAKIVALSFGIVGTLIFGGGMALALEFGIFLWGIALALMGCIPLSLAYPIYKWVLKRNKKKYGGQILQLTEELLSENA